MPKQSRRLEKPSSSNQCILDDILENLSPEWKLDILNVSIAYFMIINLAFVYIK